MLTELKYLRKDAERRSAAKSPGPRSGLPCGPMCLRACESPRAAQRFKMILALDARIHPSPRKSFGQSLISASGYAHRRPRKRNTSVRMSQALKRSHLSHNATPHVAKCIP